MSDEEKQLTPPTESNDHAAFWEQQYNEATASSGNMFHFFQAEVTRVRLIGIGSDPRNWVQSVDNHFTNPDGSVTTSKKHIVLGYQMTGKPDEELLLQGLVFTKGAWGHIANLMRTGWDLFRETGVGITVHRQNSNNRISYSILPAPVPVPIDPDMLAEAQAANWEDYLEAYAKMQEGRNKKSGPTVNAGPSVADAIVNAPANTDAW
jgi:hypothetical protein